MTHAHAEAAPGLSPVVAGLILVAVTGALVLVFARTFLSARGARMELRRCPICHGDALRSVRDERIGEGSAQVSLQCGECSTWRRLVANHADFVWEVRSLDRDRQLICAQLEELGGPERQLVTVRTGRGISGSRPSGVQR